MKLIFTIPLSDVVEMPQNEPGWTFVVSQGVLKVYKQIRS